MRGNDMCQQRADQAPEIFHLSPPPPQPQQQPQQAPLPRAAARGPAPPLRCPRPRLHRRDLRGVDDLLAGKADAAPLQRLGVQGVQVLVVDLVSSGEQKSGAAEPAGAAQVWAAGSACTPGPGMQAGRQAGCSIATPPAWRMPPAQAGAVVVCSKDAGLQAQHPWLLQPRLKDGPAASSTVHVMCVRARAAKCRACMGSYKICSRLAKKLDSRCCSRARQCVLLQSCTAPEVEQAQPALTHCDEGWGRRPLLRCRLLRPAGQFLHCVKQPANMFNRVDLR